MSEPTLDVEELVIYIQNKFKEKSIIPISKGMIRQILDYKTEYMIEKNIAVEIEECK